MLPLAAIFDATPAAFAADTPALACRHARVTAIAATACYFDLRA